MNDETPKCKICGGDDMLYDGLPAWYCQTCGAIFDDDMNTTEPYEAPECDIMYGYFGGGDPRDFTPDYELCTDKEIERWKADCARANAGEDVTAPPAGGWNKSHTIHILAPAYGIGTYKVRREDGDLDPDKYIGPSYPNGDPAGPYGKGK